MRIILLSGGSGKRLWPLSNDTRSKQFLKLLRRHDGTHESMVQRVYRQIRESGIDATVTIATSIAQVDSIKSQLGNNVEIVTEPERRDTFPAIALASTYLSMECGCSDDEVVVVMPVDQYTEEEYFKTSQKIAEAVAQGEAELVLMGVKPTFPSSKFGYIIPQAGGVASPYKVDSFKEKPDEVEAERLIEAGAFWNGGVFGFRLGYLMNIVRKYVQPTSFLDMRSRYTELPKISFDYEVVEKARSVAMVPFSGVWEDLGTWNALTEKMTERVMGKVILGENTDRTHVINELDIPIVVLGTKNLIVSASHDGVLVSDKVASTHLKAYVDGIHQRPMYEERRWGSYKVLDHTTLADGTKSLTKELCLNSGCSISYQRHRQRNEIWTFVDGKGRLLIDGEIREVGRGDVVSIRANQMHAIYAVTDLRIIEVQLGAELVEEDIERFDYEWK